jgi:SAM-dependent methyltransferase
MGRSLENRIREAEWMDEPGADPELLRRSLGFLRAVNRWLGYTRSTISHLERFSRGWKARETIRVLDVATGSADVPRAVRAWGRRRGFDLRVVGADLHASTAAQALGWGDVEVVRADARRLPFADGAFDYVITSLFLHHLDDDDVVRVLAEMGRVARRGIVAGDLLRDRRAVMWIRLFTLWANPIVKHDAVVSVKQAFRRAEVEAMARAAGVTFATYHRHFGHRFVLAGEKDRSGPGGTEKAG